MTGMGEAIKQAQVIEAVVKRYMTPKMIDEIAERALDLVTEELRQRVSAIAREEARTVARAMARDTLRDAIGTEVMVKVEGPQ